MPRTENPDFNSAAWSRHALLAAAGMRRAEELACARGAPSFGLMQRAGAAVAAIIRERWKPCRALVLCGPGNNGGDGFIAAESLRRAGWTVTAAAARAPEDLSGDAAQAAKNWQGKTLPLDKISLDEADLAVDALFGAGLARPIEGAARAVIDKLAQTKIPVIAVDLPSGINGDTGEIFGVAPRAALTVAFFRKKPGHLLLPGRESCGEIVVADIGIAGDVLNEIKPDTAENAADLWRDLFPFPKPEDHKYARGHALICGGAVMTGAARLAARAAQRTGAGLVTLAAPQSAVPIYATALESVIVRAADTIEMWRELLADGKRNAILIGPGLGAGEEQTAFVLAALETRKPCVLDADALTGFAGKSEDLFSRLHARCVLTPHEGEFARLFGSRVDSHLDKLARARKAAAIAGCTILLKGADTVIASCDGRAVVNDDAPPWLATAGAGDVLAGMILGLLAQNMHVFAAAAAAAWMHGRAAGDFGPGLIAEDLIDGLPGVLKGLSDIFKGV